MKRRLFLGAYLVAMASSPVLAQTSTSEVAIVQLYFTGINTGHLSLTRTTGTTEAAQFKTSNTHQEEAAAYQRVFTQLYQEGYSLKSTITRAEDVATWIFVKGQ
jgi:hypothetical protein